HPGNHSVGAMAHQLLSGRAAAFSPVAGMAAPMGFGTGRGNLVPALLPQAAGVAGYTAQWTKAGLWRLRCRGAQYSAANADFCTAGAHPDAVPSPLCSRSPVQRDLALGRPEPQRGNRLARCNCQSGTGNLAGAGVGRICPMVGSHVFLLVFTGGHSVDSGSAHFRAVESDGAGAEFPAGGILSDT